MADRWKARRWRTDGSRCHASAGAGLLCLILCMHGADSQTALEGDFGHPTFGMPNSYQMAHHSLRLGQQGAQGNPGASIASLSSYDQQILAKGPPGVGAEAGAQPAGLSQGPTPYASANSGCEALPGQAPATCTRQARLTESGHAPTLAGMSTRTRRAGQCRWRGAVERAPSCPRRMWPAFTQRHTQALRPQVSQHPHIPLCVPDSFSSIFICQ